MLRRLSHLLVTALALVLLLGAGTVVAEAKGAKRVAGVSSAGQDWYHAKLRVKWRAVRGASYQMRWSYTPSRLSASKVLSTRTHRGTYTGTLDRGKPWYVQVRAVKGAALGPWSKTKRLKFTNSWPQAPRLSGASASDGVRFNWRYTPFASRYRVRWSPAWYGNWPGGARFTSRTSDGWVSQYARSQGYRIPNRPAAGDNMLAVEYANPVFAQLEANNQYRSGASQRSPWVAAFPAAPAPKAGDRIRMGSYNVMLFPSSGTRVTAIARNISSHGLDIVALQEANSATASAVVRALGSTWRAAPPQSGAGQQIIFRGDRFAASGSGRYTVPNPRSPSAPLVTPWVRLTATKGTAPARSRSFLVTSVHFAEDSRKSRLEQNRDTGKAAEAAMRGINAVVRTGEPVIVAGDLRYGREPYGDRPGYVPAQPTFVRGGYYDAMASQSKSGHTYSVVNNSGRGPSARQTAHPSGLGPRSDHILMRGLRGSYRYVNVVNWSYGGVVPSDHNLIYADIAVPLR